MTLDTYAQNFRSKRKFDFPEEINLSNIRYNWRYIDKNGPVPLRVNLIEHIFMDTREASIVAEVEYDSRDKEKAGKICEYISAQLDKIAERGMAFPSLTKD